MNNGWGISTPACSQHGEQHVIDRGKAFGIPGEVVDGNDPIASWHAIRARHGLLPARAPALHARGDGVAAVRPFVVERAPEVKNEADCIVQFEKKLLDAHLIDHDALEKIHDEAPARRRRTRWR